MPETIDFEHEALKIAARFLSYHDLSQLERVDTIGAIADQLRLIWNARGAADITKLETALSSLLGAEKASPYVKTLERALRTLDW
jgi:hypothetical protein